MIFMLWYEPFSSPFDWAEYTTSRDVNYAMDKLAQVWDQCKFNPTILKPFMNLACVNEEALGKLLCLYRASNASLDQYKDLFKLSFTKLQRFINRYVGCDYIKKTDFSEEEHFNADLFKIAILMHADPIVGVINKYQNNVCEDFQKMFTSDIVYLYHMCTSDGSYIDEETAENHVRNVCKSLFITDIAKQCTTVEANCCQFKSFAERILKYGDEKCIPNMIAHILDKYETWNVYQTSKTVCPEMHTDDNNINFDRIRDIYDTVKCVLAGKPCSDLAVHLIADIDCNKRDLCKVTKLCINDFNYYNDNCVSKECEESVLAGIMNYTKIPTLSAEDFELEHEMGVLEQASFGTLAALEANNRKYEEDEEEPTDEDIPEDEEEEEQPPKKRKEPVDTNRRNFSQMENRKRNFDMDYAKFKKNANAVDQSLSKIVSSLKDMLTGQSAMRGRRKVTGMDSIGQLLARVFGTIAIFNVNGFLGLLFVVVRLANSGRVTAREKAKLISEINTEIEVIETQLNDGSVENPEARRDLIRTRRNLQDALDKIERNRGKYMTDGAKQAVRDLNEKNLNR